MGAGPCLFQCMFGGQRVAFETQSSPSTKVSKDWTLVKSFYLLSHLSTPNSIKIQLKELTVIYQISYRISFVRYKSGWTQKVSGILSTQASKDGTLVLCSVAVTEQLRETILKEEGFNSAPCFRGYNSWSAGTIVSGLMGRTS